MKLRCLKNLPVLLKNTAEIAGRVRKGVVGDDFSLAYLVVDTTQGGEGIIKGEDLSLGPAAVMIFDANSIKSYAHGEESSIYDRKCGDTVFDCDGEEIGILSDFIINLDDKKIHGVEVSAGIFKDVLDGRRELPLQAVNWVSRENAIISEEGSDWK